MERDETPASSIRANLDTILSSPMPSPNVSIRRHSYRRQPSVTHTPPAERLYPNLEEMHPSKVQQSTTKQPDSGLRLGFVDIGAKTAPSKGSNTLHATQETPTKSRGPVHMSSPGFDFKFDNTELVLSSDAQKMMEQIRQEAAKYKAEIEERERTNGENGTSTQTAGRKFAKAKGKAGRYSDVHLAEFKKMDSIANHPSAFRAQSGRAQAPPVTPASKSLKRTKSQAGLDDAEQTSPTKSVRAVRTEQKEERPESGQAKRVKRHVQDDASAARPPSRGNDSNPTTPVGVRTRPTASTVSTPTKATLLRAASAKCPKTSIASFSRSSTKPLATPTATRTEGNNKYKSSLARLSAMKSILRRPQPLFGSKLPAANTTSPAKPLFDLNKELPSLPTTSGRGKVPASPTVRHVAFTPDALSKSNLDDGNAVLPSPSPVKQIFHSHKKSSTTATPTVSYPTLSLAAPQSPSPIKATASSGVPAPVPGTFTFRTTKRLNLGNTIRQVQPEASLTSSANANYVYPVVMPSPTKKTCATMPSTNLPAVPHGLSNKKRRRESFSPSPCPSSDYENGEEAKENHSPSPSKKRRTNLGSTTTKDVGGRGLETSPIKKGRLATNRSPIKSASRSKIPGPPSGSGGKGILSLSRLNALARPREKK
ncbi:MAG: hypothetical protein M1819_003853 [Sarea resinae]|nr:MAG: hypothetical protein M1819_003853 [Sarea resinae]